MTHEVLLRLRLWLADHALTLGWAALTRDEGAILVDRDRWRRGVPRSAP